MDCYEEVNTRAAGKPVRSFSITIYGFFWTLSKCAYAGEGSPERAKISNL